ncbi:putative alpha-galactosidase B [Glycine max]|nr:putative alpha-galactosidase B [Glycine max]
MMFFFLLNLSINFVRPFYKTYRSLKGDSNYLGFDMIDEWGRMLPDPERWPSSRGRRGFTDVANKVHSMGLKFGIHLMPGTSTQASNNNMPILDTTTGQPYMESGRVWNAKDIGIPSRACKWMTNGFLAINATTGAGKAFLRSIYELYASWGVDFILNGLEHPIVLSLSPGVSPTPLMANSVSSLVNTYRVTEDDWDEWSAILADFNVARDFAASNLIGKTCLRGKSWPDLDMLPFGWLTDAAVREGPHRVTQDEQRTQMTLWCMAKSPIMYGGDLRKIDAWTLAQIIMRHFLEITTLNDVKTKGHTVTKVPFTYSLALTECTDPKASDLERICFKSPTQDQEEPFCVHKRELPIASSKQSSIQSEQIWKLKSNGTLVNGEIYVAFFNLNNETTRISANIADLPAFSRLELAATMKCISVTSACFLLCLCAIRSVSTQNAIMPPRGWNSYDSFNWIISEEEYLQNVNIVSQQLLAHGYQYAVVDYLWYRSLKGDKNSLGFDVIDKWGRMLPDPERWPSSRGGRGFTNVGNKVHRTGLKFGIHLMAGISTQAFNNNTPILDTQTGQPYMESGRVWKARDIGIPSRPCKWMSNGFMAINTKTGAGKAFLRSIYELYASWGVDFVKLDCVFGDNLDLGEITSVSEILNGLNKPIALSLSPGVSATPQMAKMVSNLVNTYRVTGDDWDEWSAILAHFNIARDFAASNLIGGKGLKGKSWPDLDMLPFGWLTDPGAHEGPYRFTRLTQDEQRTQFPHITRLNDVKTKRHNVTKVQFTYSLGLTECTDPKAYGWSSEKYYQDLERICYKSPKHDQEEPFCVHKRELPTASSKQTSIQSEQIWKLKSNGTLVNGHSGMCATVEHVLAEGYPNRIRSWIATGRKGETYVAFFNLSNEKTTISASIIDLAIVYPGRRKFILCSGNEMWSGRTIRTNNMFSAEVPGHGCALFVLQCS